MREANAAWAVLRSPAGRAAYDDELRAAGLLPARADGPGDPGGPGLGGSRSGGASRPPAGRVPSPTEQLVEPRRDLGIMEPRRPHIGRWVALGVVAVVVALGVIAAIAASQDRDRVPAEPEVHTNAFEVGSCISVRPGPTVVAVPCTQANAGRIVATTDYPRPCPTGTETYSLVDASLNLCLRPS